MLTDDAAPFAAWLAAHDPDATAGRQKSCAYCPLAHYLHDMGRTTARVNRLYIVVGRGYKREWLPTWAARFIRRIDKLNRVQDHGYVTFRDCRAALRQVLDTTDVVC